MDKLDYYRETIKKLLTQYHQMATSFKTECSDGEEMLAFDEERDQYLWFRWGWHEKSRIRYITMYLRIKNGKVWIEEDLTDLCIVDDLLSAGIPKSDIVLGFHPPSKRVLTDFAIT